MAVRHSEQAGEGRNPDFVDDGFEAHAPSLPQVVMGCNTACSDYPATLCSMNDEKRIRQEQGARLRQAREAAGYGSARDAAISNNWAESSYRAHESGGRTIGQDDAEKYARKFRLKGARITAAEILFPQQHAQSLITTATDPAKSVMEGERLPHVFELIRSASVQLAETFAGPKIAEEWRSVLDEAFRTLETRQHLRGTGTHRSAAAAKASPETDQPRKRKR